MTRPYQLEQTIRQILYAFKTQYGAGPVSFYSFGGDTINLTTGVKSVAKDVTVVKRVVLLPARVFRDLVSTISKISADKQFVYGGTFDTRKRAIMVDRRDAPNLVLKVDDWFVYNGQKYEVKHFDEVTDAAYVILGEHMVGDTPENIHVLGADNLIRVEDSGGGTL